MSALRFDGKVGVVTGAELLAHWTEINDVSSQHLAPDTHTWSAGNQQRLERGLAG
jgi:hypothetical protein